MDVPAEDKAKYIHEKVYPLMDSLSLALVMEQPEDPEAFLLKYLWQRAHGRGSEPPTTSTLPGTAKETLPATSAELDHLRAAHQEQIEQVQEQHVFEMNLRDQQLKIAKQADDFAHRSLLAELYETRSQNSDLQVQVTDLRVELELLRLQSNGAVHTLATTTQASGPPDSNADSALQEQKAENAEQPVLTTNGQAEPESRRINQEAARKKVAEEANKCVITELKDRALNGSPVGSVSPKGALDKLLEDAAENDAHAPVGQTVDCAVLRAHFLSAVYANGEGMETRDTEYDRVPAEGQALMYVHRSSGIRVWCCALELQCAGRDNLEVVFHYTSEADFKAVTEGMHKVQTWWTGLERRDAAWGAGVYMSGMEPAQFGSKEAVARNNFSARIPIDGLEKIIRDVAYCVPILAPKDIVYNVAVRPTPEMSHGAGRSVQNKLLGNTDVWVVRCEEEDVWLKTVATNYEERLRSIIAARDVVGGSWDPDKVVGIGNLSALLEAGGRLAEAEPFCRRKLDMLEKHHGDSDLRTLAAASDLAMLLRQQEKLDEAEPLYRRVFEGYKQILGPIHLTTLASASNLAGCLDEQGMCETAEPLHRQVLEGRSKGLGERHADTLTSLNNLANCLDEQGRPQDAEVLHRRTLEGREILLGRNHPDTLTSVNNLAACLNDQAKLQEAEQLYRRALTGCKVTLGDLHPDTLQSMGNLGALLKAEGHTEEAEELYRKALEGREEILGASHPSTLRSFKRLASLLEEQGRSADARKLTLEFQQRAASSPSKSRRSNY